ncbi:MAG: DUF3293 domain-containing protein [Zoogloeaceae bacterium]|jgi:hypothetical protein|nr:DUF3293 domain-containing protein [Zoogloeaceae bacterium]
MEANKLWTAYRRAVYRVFLPVGSRRPGEGFKQTGTITLDLRIGHPHKGLDGWLRRYHHARRWTILTACNPASMPLDAVENAARQEALAEDLRALHLPFFPGENRDESGQWPVEPSFFISGIAKPDARRLARKYGQNAFVFGYRGEIKLFWMPPALWHDAPHS